MYNSGKIICSLSSLSLDLRLRLRRRNLQRCKGEKIQPNVQLSRKFEEMLEEPQTHRISLWKGSERINMKTASSIACYQPDPQLSKLHMLKELLTSLNSSKYCRRWWGTYLWHTKLRQDFWIWRSLWLISYICPDNSASQNDWQNSSMKNNTCWRVILTFFAVMSDSIALYFIKP